MLRGGTGVHGGSIRINAHQRQVSSLPVHLKITNKNGSVNSIGASANKRNKKERSNGNGTERYFDKKDSFHRLRSLPPEGGHSILKRKLSRQGSLAWVCRNIKTIDKIQSSSFTYKNSSPSCSKK